MELKIFRNLFCSIFFLNSAFSLLDISELSSFQYSIDISSQPVLLDETKEQEGILLSSKYGQRYQCQFESLSQFSQKAREEEENASKTSVLDLLQPMEGKPCLTTTTGWWTYEFCYKKQIKQYHVSDQKVVGDILYLGSYSEEFNWSAKHEKKMPEVTHRYHSHQYVNGSVCDLTGAMRSAEVRFKCKEDSVDSVDGVEEPSTCRYLVHISTPRLCRHPSLRPVPDKKSLPITCSPVLEGPDYRDYLELQRRLKEEQEEEGKGNGEGEEVAGRRGGKDGEGKGEDSSSELDLSSFEKSSDVDLAGNEFGFIEIGNTKIKFYVLNYDGMLGEKKDEKLESESAGKEAPSPKGKEENEEEDENEKESSSNPDATLSSAEGDSDSVPSKDDSAPLKDDSATSLDGVEDEEGGEEFVDTKEFMDIYKRLLSNKRLKSFISRKQGSSGATLVPKEEPPRAVEGPKGGEDPPRNPTTNSLGEAKDKDVISRTLAKGDQKPDQNESGNVDDALDGGKKEGDASRSDKVEDPVKVEGKSREGKEMEKEEQELDGKKPKDGSDPATSRETSKAEVHVVGEMFRKGSPLLTEHKSIHHMIMAIIKQSDRTSKEVSRHENIEKNYEFDWAKQKKLVKKRRKKKEKEGEDRKEGTKEDNEEYQREDKKEDDEEYAKEEAVKEDGKEGSKEDIKKETKEDREEMKNREVKVEF